jgi:hypothetical protein
MSNHAGVYLINKTSARVVSISLMSSLILGGLLVCYPVLILFSDHQNGDRHVLREIIFSRSDFMWEYQRDPG